MPAPLTLEVVVVVVVFVVEVTDVKVDTIDVVSRLVDVVTVVELVDVEVTVKIPPNGAKCIIVESSWLCGGLSMVLMKSRLEPTIHPLVGEVM